ncbi:MAG: HNH endonuclease [Candidatus Eisenbacteria bacterium]|nr:HNH endonuclease [Candidatus Eisenbacteria bacterium]
MRYWWVNQNQTSRQEIEGGYLWSPKRRADGVLNPFYDFMREVSPGDIVFSFAGTFIIALGFAASHAYEAPKPLEFGSKGAYWNQIGWRVDVRFTRLTGAVRPKDHIRVLAPLLPEKYSPLRRSGDGLQGVYLTQLSSEFAGAIVNLIGREAQELMRGTKVADTSQIQPAVGLVEWEEHQIADLSRDESLPETTREALILARRGQGLFKARVRALERACRVTRVDRIEHLRASHCKPWRDSSNEERLDPENGLLLTPSIDHLFDRGFIGFANDGELLISPVAHRESLERMGVDSGRPANVGEFSAGQRRFLEYHRENVLLKCRHSD